MKNFHTHTYLCKHAIGVPADYIPIAAEHNCTALGFSDHCPYPDNTWIGMHMELYEQEQYRRMVTEAKTAASFPVYFGYECEWHKRFYSWYHDKLIYENGAEYLIYGPHWVNDGNDFLYVSEFNDKKTFMRYVDLTIEGMNSGLYSYIAHPDLFLESVSDVNDFYTDLCRQIIRAAIDVNMPLEINGNGCIKEKVKRNGVLEYRYPVKKFWRLAREMGARIIIAADAHDPATLVFNLELAADFAHKLDISYDANYEPKFYHRRERNEALSGAPC